MTLSTELGAWKERGGFAPEQLLGPCCTPGPGGPVRSWLQRQISRTATKNLQKAGVTQPSAFRMCPGLPCWPSSHLTSHLSHAGPWPDALPTCLPGKPHQPSPLTRPNPWAAGFMGLPRGCPSMASSPHAAPQNLLRFWCVPIAGHSSTGPSCAPAASWAREHRLSPAAWSPAGSGPALPPVPSRVQSAGLGCSLVA